MLLPGTWTSPSLSEAKPCNVQAATTIAHFWVTIDDIIAVGATARHVDVLYMRSTPERRHQPDSMLPGSNVAVAMVVIVAAGAVRDLQVCARLGL